MNSKSLLEKVAGMNAGNVSDADMQQHKKDLRSTAVIGGIGVVGGQAVSHSFPSPKVNPGTALATAGAKAEKFGLSHKSKLGLAIGAVGLAGDYAAVKINNYLDKKSTDMTNKYLDKIASFGETARGWVSPAWQENYIAKKNGKEGLKGVGANVSKHIGGGFRQAGRSLTEGVVGGAVGAAAGVITKNPGLMHAGASVGANVGSIHGYYKSTKNQAAEAHKKYGDK